MDTKTASTEDLLDERNRLEVALYFASHCDDEELTSRHTHSIDMIDVELMRR